MGKNKRKNFFSNEFALLMWFLIFNFLYLIFWYDRRIGIPPCCITYYGSLTLSFASHTRYVSLLHGASLLVYHHIPRAIRCIQVRHPDAINGPFGRSRDQLLFLCCLWKRGSRVALRSCFPMHSERVALYSMNLRQTDRVAWSPPPQFNAFRWLHLHTTATAFPTSLVETDYGLKSRRRDDVGGDGWRWLI